MGNLGARCEPVFLRISLSPPSSMYQCLLFLFVGGAAAHGSMTLPPSRNGGTLAEAGLKKTVAQDFYSNGVPIAGAPTLPKDLYTVPWHTNGPWRAPGTVPVNSPCGKDIERPPGTDGLDLPETKRTQWLRLPPLSSFAESN